MSMVIRRKNLAILIFSFFGVFSTAPIFGAEITNVILSENPSAQHVQDCGNALRKLLASSNQAMIASEHPQPDDLGLLIEEHDDRKGVEFIEITNEREKKTDSAPGAGHYGWVVFDPKTGELSDESIDETHPVKLKVNIKAVQEYQSCRAAEQQCFQATQNMDDDPTFGFYPNPFEVAGDSSERYVKSSGNRQPFYWAPNKNCAVHAFLVNQDKVLALSWGQNNGFIWSRYIHPGTQQITEGWLPQDVLETKAQRCADVRQESGIQNLLADAFVMREVANKQQRLYFYDAPDKVCQREEKTFIIDGNKVQILQKSTFGGYVFAHYTHPETQKVTEGWVLASGLK